jgi:hypothetical protein
MVLAFLSLALGYVGLFLALRSQLKTIAGRIGLTLLLVSALGLTIVAVFVAGFCKLQTSGNLFCHFRTAEVRGSNPLVSTSFSRLSRVGRKTRVGRAGFSSLGPLSWLYHPECLPEALLGGGSACQRKTAQLGDATARNVIIVAWNDRWGCTMEHCENEPRRGELRARSC